MKNLPNALTILRIALCVPLVYVEPFSIGFFMLYSICGVTDMLDGFLARRFGCASPAGAKLDSAADFLLTAVLLFRLVPAMKLPIWLFWWIAGIALIKLCSLAVNYVRHKQFAFLHTYANKTAGLLLFCLPFGYPFFGVNAGAVLCVFASLAAIEELILCVTSSVLNQDVKGIFFSKNN
ncbi:MAG: CDP-alcohol phosphatidyltransferase family protein [Clostridium sp.]|uniref:CDP-alcohol phosphatidyltransferase family protein n=1 Tax=Clostridium sp. TaxID=1506 RepID=UPI002905FC55|nr:CDP-alcohol phosphatidyltransferase family protein [Clostridium sp.]MDU7337806.1 CDP-alcohol phosphatidyltransferase family protein [Clostridium sp.]